MKKQLFYISFFILCIQTLSAQAWNGKGDQKIQFGINGWGNGTGISGKYDFGISNMLSVGAGANIYFGNDQKNSTFLYGRLNLHLQETLGLPEEWDVYPGLDLGILGNEFELGARLGVRYFFNNKWGAFLEAGNNGSLGVSINL